MSVLRRFVQFSAAAAFVILLGSLRKLNTDGSFPAKATVRVHGDPLLSLQSRLSLDFNSSTESSSRITHASSVTFRPGILKPPGSTYSRVVVVPCLQEDNISWIANELPGTETAIYVANDLTAPLHPPQNKGHEVMVYLTYLIDHYLDLPDILIFMHAHRWTHHNLGLLGHDSAEMVRRLNNDYVVHEGYVNLRCQWHQGCPEWLHPRDTGELMIRQEQVVLSRSWHELFPSEPLPEALGQPCCAQFALSKDRVLSIPLSRFVFYRDWLLRTPLTDYVSGRIWEYLWQIIFTGNSIHCPSEEICHCQGFGVCFGGNDGYEKYQQLHQAKEKYELELEDLRRKQAMVEAAIAKHGKKDGASGVNMINTNKHLYLSDRITTLEREIKAREAKAIQKGRSREED